MYTMHSYRLFYDALGHPPKCLWILSSKSPCLQGHCDWKCALIPSSANIVVSRSAEGPYAKCLRNSDRGLAWRDDTTPLELFQRYGFLDIEWTL